MCIRDSRRLVYGIRERMNAEGQEVLALDPDSLEQAIARMLSLIHI